LKHKTIKQKLEARSIHTQDLLRFEAIATPHLNTILSLYQWYMKH